MSRHYPTTALITIAAVIAFSAAVSAAQTPTMAPMIPAADSTSPAPSPSPDCLTQLLTLSDCLSYVLKDSNETKPDKACCPELADLVGNYPTCLCTLFTLDASSYGLEVDYGRAFGLPSACSISVPPAVTSCVREANVPVGAPSPSQGGGAAGPGSGEGGMMAPSPANNETTGGSGGSGGSSHGSPTAPVSKLATQLLSMLVLPLVSYLW